MPNWSDAGAEWIQPTGPNGPIPRKTAWMVYFDCTCTYRISTADCPKSLAWSCNQSYRNKAGIDLDCYGRRTASFVRVSLWHFVTSARKKPNQRCLMIRLHSLLGYGRIEVKPQQYPQWMCTLMHWVMSVAKHIGILKALESQRDFDHFYIGTVPGLVAASTSKRLECSEFKVVKGSWHCITFRTVQGCQIMRQ